MDIWLKVFAYHEKLNGSAIGGIALEKFITGILFGLSVWFIQSRRIVKDDPAGRNDSK
jgi:hypothetical protein